MLLLCCIPEAGGNGTIQMEKWNEIRTAASVARYGTITEAAGALGIHRATVTRHVDALEEALGAKLFQRHARGFTPTELGAELLRIADATDAQFGELKRMANGTVDEVAGTLTVTALDVLVPTVLPIVRAFRQQHSKVDLHLITSDRTLKLHYGEADVAFRIGRKPDDPDNVVLPVMQLEVGLFGPAESSSPLTTRDLRGQPIVGPDRETPKTPYFEWLTEHSDPKDIVLRSNSVATLWDAVRSGIGIGFLPRRLVHDRLAEIVPAQPDWYEPVWAVTHVDLHRSARVQAFLKTLKASRKWL